MYPPVVFLLGVPFHLLSHAALGRHDHRITYLLFFCAALWACRRLAKARAEGLIAVALIGLSLQCLARGGARWGYAAPGVCFGLACATKHAAWFPAPFYVLYPWGNRPVHGAACSRRDKAEAITRTWALPAGSAAAVCLIPFFDRSPARFSEATVLYLSGGGSHPYPIRRTQAFGLPMLLASPDGWRLLVAASSGPLRFLRPLSEGPKIRSECRDFPFWILQAGIALPVLGLVLHRRWRRITLASARSGYAVTLVAYRYCSRYFLNSHLGYVVLLYCLAFLVRRPLARTGSAAIQPSEAPPAVPRTAGTPRLAPRGVPAIPPLVPLLASYYVAVEWRALGAFFPIPVALTLLYMVLHSPPERRVGGSGHGRPRFPGRLALARSATLLGLVLSMVPW